MRILLTKLKLKHKLVFLIIFGAATSIKLIDWYHYKSTLGFPSHIPFIFWESFTVLALITWNPRGIRLILLTVLGFLLYELVLYNFFIGGSISTYPFWDLFRNIYQSLKLDSLYAFLIESVLLISMTVSLFWGKPKIDTELLDND